MYYKKLVGEKVYLSPMDINNEVDILTKWFNEDEDIAYYNGFFGSLIGKDKMIDLLNKWNDGPFAFSIVSKEDDEFVGHVSFFNIDSHNIKATMGIYIGEKYRKHGFGKEAIKLAIDYLFNTQRFKAIHLEVFSYNENAINVYKSIGFVECGRWHNARYHLNEYHDIVLMELLKSE